MTGMLASIQNIHELQQIKHLPIDIIDCKQPANGALGALPPAVVKQIVECRHANQLISATVGDLPMHADTLCDAVIDTAKTGVDYVKIGFIPDPELIDCIQKLSRLTTKIELIAVLFADHTLDLALIKRLKLAGFKGVMLDTIDKTKGGLTSFYPLQTIQQFIQEAKQINLLTGLAGSLKLQDISLLSPLHPDYLGFRTALCQNLQRTQQLDTEQTQKVLYALQTQVNRNISLNNKN